MTITQFLKHESMKLITWRMKCTWMKSPNMHDNIWIKMTIIPIDLLVYVRPMYLVCIPPLTHLLPFLASKGHLPKTHENFVEWHWHSPNVSWVNVITFTQFVFCEPAWNSHSIVFVEWHYNHPILCLLNHITFTQLVFCEWLHNSPTMCLLNCITLHSPIFF
jgi:hypothetical protein